MSNSVVSKMLITEQTVAHIAGFVNQRSWNNNDNVLIDNFLPFSMI